MCQMALSLRRSHLFSHRVYIAQGPSSTSFSGSGYTWPVHGIVTQFASWYHEALDLAAPYGTPIVAAKSGVVREANTGGCNYGYGNDVVIDNGGGYYIFVCSHGSS